MLCIATLQKIEQRNCTKSRKPLEKEDTLILSHQQMSPLLCEPTRPISMKQLVRFRDDKVPRKEFYQHLSVAFDPFGEGKIKAL